MHRKIPKVLCVTVLRLALTRDKDLLLYIEETTRIMTGREDANNAKLGGSLLRARPANLQPASVIHVNEWFDELASFMAVRLHVCVFPSGVTYLGYALVDITPWRGWANIYNHSW